MGKIVDICCCCYGREGRELDGGRGVVVLPGVVRSAAFQPDTVVEKGSQGKDEGRRRRRE